MEREETLGQQSYWKYVAGAGLVLVVGGLCYYYLTADKEIQDLQVQTVPPLFEWDQNTTRKDTTRTARITLKDAKSFFSRGGDLIPPAFELAVDKAEEDGDDESVSNLLFAFLVHLMHEAKQAEPARRERILDAVMDPIQRLKTALEKTHSLAEGKMLTGVVTVLSTKAYFFGTSREDLTDMQECVSKILEIYFEIIKSKQEVPEDLDYTNSIPGYIWSNPHLLDVARLERWAALAVTHNVPPEIAYHINTVLAQRLTRGEEYQKALSILERPEMMLTYDYDSTLTASMYCLVCRAECYMKVGQIEKGLQTQVVFVRFFLSKSLESFENPKPLLEGVTEAILNQIQHGHVEEAREFLDGFILKVIDALKPFIAVGDQEYTFVDTDHSLILHYIIQELLRLYTRLKLDHNTVQFKPVEIPRIIDGAIRTMYSHPWERVHLATHLAYTDYCTVYEQPGLIHKAHGMMLNCMRDTRYLEHIIGVLLECSRSNGDEMYVLSLLDQFINHHSEKPNAFESNMKAICAEYAFIIGGDATTAVKHIIKCIADMNNDLAAATTYEDKLSLEILIAVMELSKSFIQSVSGVRRGDKKKAHSRMETLFAFTAKHEEGMDGIPIPILEYITNSVVSDHPRLKLENRTKIDRWTFLRHDLCQIFAVHGLYDRALLSTKRIRYSCLAGPPMEHIIIALNRDFGPDSIPQKIEDNAKAIAVKANPVNRGRYIFGVWNTWLNYAEVLLCRGKQEECLQAIEHVQRMLSEGECEDKHMKNMGVKVRAARMMNEMKRKEEAKQWMKGVREEIEAIGMERDEVEVIALNGAVEEKMREEDRKRIEEEMIKRKRRNEEEKRWRGVVWRDVAESCGPDEQAKKKYWERAKEEFKGLGEGWNRRMYESLFQK